MDVRLCGTDPGAEDAFPALKTVPPVYAFMRDRPSHAATNWGPATNQLQALAHPSHRLADTLLAYHASNSIGLTTHSSDLGLPKNLTQPEKLDVNCML